jgi:HEPN domain-containing protein
MSPRKSEKIFKREYGDELLRIAEQDLASAQILAAHGGRVENSIYHAQQAIEKALKAVLCAKGIPVPLVHDAGILVAKLPGDLSPPGGYSLSDLTPFATIKRYEEGAYAVTPEEHNQAIRLAEDVLHWARNNMNP